MHPAWHTRHVCGRMGIDRAEQYIAGAHRPDSGALPGAQGEHGTGRNVAPYVEMEWGTKAYELMWELKELFDPDYVLNPGVILNKARRLVSSVWSSGAMH